jgi:RNA polymerase sigma-70 factor (ECF subfamily)
MHSHEPQVARQIARAVAGCRAALLNRARSLVGPSEAEDLVQSTMEKALLHLDSFQPHSNLVGWLKRIMVNLMADEWRRRRLLLQQDVDPDTIPSEPATELETWEGLTAADVRAAARGLPPGFRQVFELHHEWHLPYGVIARQLHVPLGTVGSRLKRAREQLRVVLVELVARRAEGVEPQESAPLTRRSRAGHHGAARAPRPGRCAPAESGSPAAVVAVA